MQSLLQSKYAKSSTQNSQKSGAGSQLFLRGIVRGSPASRNPADNTPCVTNPAVTRQYSIAHLVDVFTGRVPPPEGMYLSKPPPPKKPATTRFAGGDSSLLRQSVANLSILGITSPASLFGGRGIRTQARKTPFAQKHVISDFDVTKNSPILQDISNNPPSIYSNFKKPLPATPPIFGQQKKKIPPPPLFGKEKSKIPPPPLFGEKLPPPPPPPPIFQAGVSGGQKPTLLGLRQPQQTQTSILPSGSASFGQQQLPSLQQFLANANSQYFQPPPEEIEGREFESERESAVKTINETSRQIEREEIAVTEATFRQSMSQAAEKADKFLFQSGKTENRSSSSRKHQLGSSSSSSLITSLLSKHSKPKKSKMSSPNSHRRKRKMRMAFVDTREFSTSTMNLNLMDTSFSAPATTTTFPFPPAPQAPTDTKGNSRPSSATSTSSFFSMSTRSSFSIEVSSPQTQISPSSSNGTPVPRGKSRLALLGDSQLTPTQNTQQKENEGETSPYFNGLGLGTIKNNYGMDSMDQDEDLQPDRPPQTMSLVSKNAVGLPLGGKWNSYF